MPRRKDSFSRALADAQKRLEKAQAEQHKANVALRDLNNEIPRLKATIAVLRNQMEPSRLTGAGRPAEEPMPPANMTPEELAKWYTERDLSNVGSIVPERPAAEPTSEDEMLPDDFATGKR